MEYEDFLLKAIDFISSENRVKSLRRNTDKLDKYKEGVPLFMSSVVIGGASGGNCWGGDASHYTVYDRGSADFDSLMKFLDQHFPEISFRKFREIMGAVEKTNSTEYEYYGNYTEYEVSFITVGKLYKIIFENVNEDIAEELQ